MEIFRCILLPKDLKSLSTFIYSDNVAVKKKIWFVGDNFLSKVFPTFGTMQREAIITRREELFLYRHFELFASYQPNNVGVRRLIARMFNSFAAAINRDYLIPDYVILMPDINIINSTNFFDYVISWILSRSLHWLSNKINKHLDARTNYLSCKKLGALPHNKSTRIIWVTALERPKHKVNGLLEKSVAQVKKFNSIMEEVAEEHGHSIMEIKSVTKFNWYGYITTPGKVDFWKELDEKFRRFHDLATLEQAQHLLNHQQSN